MTLPDPTTPAPAPHSQLVAGFRIGLVYKDYSFFLNGQILWVWCLGAIGGILGSMWPPPPLHR